MYYTALTRFPGTRDLLNELLHTFTQGNVRDVACAHLPAGHGDLMQVHHGMGHCAVE